jgi:hypothetical protein
VTNSESSLIAIILGLGVFLIIMAIGWRSVQNRRILRLQGADGKETIIVAGEDDEISSVVTTTETKRTSPAPAAAPSVLVVNTGVADPAPAQTAADADADAVGSGRGGRAESSTE